MGAESSSRHGFGLDGFQFLYHIFTVDLIDWTNSE